jgi:hypothetical protein
MGWSFVWFLHQGAGSRDWNERWGAIPSRYVAEWGCSRDRELARRYALDGVDLGALEVAWRNFTLRRR